MRADPINAPLEVAEPVRARVAPRWLDFVALMKPRLSTEVLFTSAGGMYVAHRPLSLQSWLLTLLGIAGTVGAANAINCVLERRSDAFMARTAGRPLPNRRISTRAAIVFAAVLGLASLPLIAIGSNLLTAGLGLLALVSYAFVYTPLKSRTHWAMYVGAVPGALPPLMGWTAATGAIDAIGLALFAILFVWQLPHFIAIAAFRKNEYLAAGLTSLPLEKGDTLAKWEALAWTVLLVAVSLLPAWLKLAGVAYVIAAVVLGMWLLFTTAQKWNREAAPFWGKRVFRASLVYLTLLFIALAVG
ncbi:MAG: heme o synthase [Archangium sp.]